jgi:lysozyme family protein
MIGDPPFTWEESAQDALAIEGLCHRDKWADIGVTLDRIERYNGLGYRKRGLTSPYLWAGTNNYWAGKFVADGQFNPEVMDKQPGCAGLLRLLGYTA